jgi:hypothetical protein
MAQPILDSEEFIDNLIKLIESHLQTVGGIYITSCTYTPSPTLQPGIANWTGYTIPPADEFEQQQKENEARNNQTPTPSPTPSPGGSGGSEPESKTGIEVIFVAGLTDGINFATQVNTFKSGYGTSVKVESFKWDTDPANINKVLASNPKIPIFLFSAGCTQVTRLLDNPNVDKTKIFLVEPYTVYTANRTRMESAIDNGIPSRNVFVGPVSARGSNINRDTTKVPNEILHLGALEYAAKLSK